MVEHWLSGHSPTGVVEWGYGIVLCKRQHPSIFLLGVSYNELYPIIHIIKPFLLIPSSQIIIPPPPPSPPSPHSPSPPPTRPPLFLLLPSLLNLHRLPPQHLPRLHRRPKDRRRPLRRRSPLRRALRARGHRVLVAFRIAPSRVVRCGGPP